ncbi:hypothetical protein HELRODRAFT_193873 [Helobdella robusta]|uniref:Ig-like domain-containing protein n=1 Tax=Helobdella robusta TaxID=6412 RepID=T1FVF7_HELRO|nr:hypothetical protein HELRODRAFT_193873 [Helobdella robusta]ESN94014.1 hypothetical protein HELRODRAFT_193873 [Helobdella robusta]
MSTVTENTNYVSSFLHKLYTFECNANGDEDNSLASVEHVWSVTTVAAGDTAVIHCSFDALFPQLKNGNIDWVKESPSDEKELQKQQQQKLQQQQQQFNTYRSSNNNNNAPNSRKRKRNQNNEESVNINPFLNSNNNNDNNNHNNYYFYQNFQDSQPTVIATGRNLAVKDKRFRVYRPHNSALSVLIIRRVRKSDGGYYRCNLAGSSTRHKYMILNVTDSKIESQTSEKETRVKVDNDVTLWCNASGYPVPIVYWTREDRNRTLPDGSHQYWGNGLFIKSATEYDSGVYVCYIDNFVKPVVHHKFSIIVEDNPWKLDGYKMRYDSHNWFPASTHDPLPVLGKSFLLMCETRGNPNPQPSITWYKGRDPVTNGKNYYIIDDSSDWKKNAVSSTLVIIRYGPQFEGRYVCLANNGFRIRKQKFLVADRPQHHHHHHDQSGNVVRKKDGQTIVATTAATTTTAAAAIVATPPTAKKYFDPKSSNNKFVNNDNNNSNNRKNVYKVNLNNNNNNNNNNKQDDDDDEIVSEHSGYDAD